MSKAWVLALLATVFVAGAALRLSHARDMEYKEDEEYDFVQSQLVGTTQAWPWIGMPSGVDVPNPGMSVWVFAALAKATGARNPPELARAVSTVALSGILLLLPFAFLCIRDAREREPWLWAFALAAVNPFLVYYQRKLWPEPFLPPLTLLVILGWWKRDRWWAAFIWGLVGACLGQVHMSGFFFALALVAWTVLFGRHLRGPGPARTAWSGWFAGSALGALPLLPWLRYVLAHPVAQGVISTGGGWGEAVQLKFWVFWITDALGLHLGNPLGLLRGQSGFAQISDFVRYPLWGGHATYIVGAAHVLALAIGVWVLWFAVRRLGRMSRRMPARLADAALGAKSQTAFLQSAAFLGFGILMTLSLVRIRRYYMLVCFPLELVFLARLALALPRHWGRRALGALVLAEFVISAGFVEYVHVNDGSVWGDYGVAYHALMEARAHGRDLPHYSWLKTPAATPDSAAAPSTRPGH